MGLSPPLRATGEPGSRGAAGPEQPPGGLTGLQELLRVAVTRGQRRPLAEHLHVRHHVPRAGLRGAEGLSTRRAGVPAPRPGAPLPPHLAALAEEVAGFLPESLPEVGGGAFHRARDLRARRGARSGEAPVLGWPPPGRGRCRGLGAGLLTGVQAAGSAAGLEAQATPDSGTGSAGAAITPSCRSSRREAGFPYLTRPFAPIGR